MPRKSKQFPIIDMAKTGKRLQELIEEHGYTVKDIQTILIISSHQSVYSWYAGRTMPSIDNFVALSKLLDVSIDDMIVCIDTSENRIHKFKIEEFKMAYYDVINYIEKTIRENGGQLDIHLTNQLHLETGISIEEIISISKIHCDL